MKTFSKLNLIALLFCVAVSQTHAAVSDFGLFISPFDLPVSAPAFNDDVIADKPGIDMSDTREYAKHIFEPFEPSYLANKEADLKDLYKAEEHTVDPAAVPLPANVWLLGSGLLGMFLLRRRKGNWNLQAAHH